ncbi:MAG: hypothetical protein NVSMB1_21110 [Polyangiales bacterium]
MHPMFFRHTVSLVVIASAIVPALACTRKRDSAGGLHEPDKSNGNIGDARPPSGGPSIVESALLLPGATCPFPARLNKDTTIAAGCVVDVLRNGLVEGGSTLTVEAGATLRFKIATYLEVGHKGSRLVVRGTKDKPVVFTSAEAKQRPGDWVGVVFDDATGEGSLLDHTVIEYAGRDSHGGQGALTVFSAFPPGRFAVKSTLFRHNNQAAVANRHPLATFAAFDHNTFVDNATDMRVSAQVLAAIGADNNFGGTIEVSGGTISKGGAWPKTKFPIVITEPVFVNSDDAVKQAAMFTIAPDTVLKFAPKTWLEVATASPGALVANRVTFSSAAEKPAAGDWVGLLFGDKTQRSRVAESIIEFAGAEEHGGDAAITIVGSRSLQGLDLTLLNLTFRDIKQGHVSTNGEGCDKILDPRNGMVWAGGGIDPCK